MLKGRILLRVGGISEVLRHGIEEEDEEGLRLGMCAGEEAVSGYFVWFEGAGGFAVGVGG